MKRRDFIAALWVAQRQCGRSRRARSSRASDPPSGSQAEARLLPKARVLPPSWKGFASLDGSMAKPPRLSMDGGEGMSERFAEIAGRFVQLKVDVIVTSGTASVVAAKQATTVIPIVFAVAGDPIANDLVTSLSRPGGNITGLSTVATDLAGKRVELLREAVHWLPALGYPCECEQSVIGLGNE